MNTMFDVGDLVHIKDEMPESMSHFTKDKDAVVVEYSHNGRQKGNDWEHSYTLHIKGQGRTAWYHNFNLDLIEKNRMDLLKVWEDEEEKERKLHSDLNWIFANGKEVLHGASGATIEALASCLGVKSLWGSHGEGFVYYQNAMIILRLAKPFLESGDKAGWVVFAEEKRTESLRKEKGEYDEQSKEIS